MKMWSGGCGTNIVTCDLLSCLLILWLMKWFLFLFIIIINDGVITYKKVVLLYYKTHDELCKTFELPRWTDDFDMKIK